MIPSAVPSSRRQPRGLLVCALFLVGLAAGCNSSSSGGSGTTVAPATSSTSAVGSSGATANTSSSASNSGSALIAQGSLDVLSYNVAGLPQGISSSNPTANMPQISPKLNTYPLVLVQEDFFYHADLMRQATHAFQSPAQSLGFRPMNDGLNRFSESPYAAHERITWNDCHGIIGNSSDCLATKGYTFARHELEPGVELDVYNLHADAGGDTGDEEARAKQFAQLAQDMLQRSAGRAVLVAGDTNLKQSRAADMQTLDTFLAAVQLRDSARELGNLPDLIDRVMLRDGGGLILKPTHWRLANEFVDAQGGPLSDHPAVHVTLSWERYR